MTKTVNTIIGMISAQLVNLKSYMITWAPTAKEIKYLIFNLPGLLSGTIKYYAWEYDYEKLKAGKPGKHAILRKGQHSDGFINVKELMADYPDICRLLGYKLARKLASLKIKPDYVVGVPSAAVLLGKFVAEYLGVPFILLKKENDKEFSIDGKCPAPGTVLLVDDVYTTGDGRNTAAKTLIEKGFTILSEKVCVVSRNADRSIISLTRFVKKEWWPEKGETCKLCAAGSIAEKPKTSPKVWEDFVHSQD